ncbi:MAG: arginine repressor [Oscillospiraceae bacterium]|nr:arginine repressor [Oscillospiraceae bacterium]
MKSTRLREIGRIVSENEIATQEELLEHLSSRGFKVTQATVSRDVKELRLIKRSTQGGKQCYAFESGRQEFPDRFRNIFHDSVISVDTACNIVVVKCHVGMGNAACEALDTMSFPHIVGTIAGDNTIFAAADSPESALELAGELSALL